MLAAAGHDPGRSDDWDDGHEDILHLFKRHPCISRRADVRQV